MAPSPRGAAGEPDLANKLFGDINRTSLRTTRSAGRSLRSSRPPQLHQATSNREKYQAGVGVSPWRGGRDDLGGNMPPPSPGFVASPIQKIEGEWDEDQSFMSEGGESKATPGVRRSTRAKSVRFPKGT